MPTDDPICLSLFSGIGGLDLGLHRAGFRHVGFCESDSYRRDVLRARWPGVPVWDDVACIGRKRPDSEPLSPWQQLPERVDLLAGGFPCQDLSVAGKRVGLNGARSGLFFEYARIAKLVRPRWLLVENVPGLLSSNGGRDFGIVLGTLADLGYGVAWRIVDSRFFGVPQRRRRVFIVGALADTDSRAAAQRAGEILAVGTRCPRHPATRGEAREDVAGTLGGGSGERGWAQDTERMTSVAHTVTDHSKGRAPDSQDHVVTALAPGFAASSHEEAPVEGNDTDTGARIAAPLSHGSNPNSNAAGRRREDDVNLVSFDAEYSNQAALGDDKAVLTRKLRRAISDGTMVRRLTPTEAERLQGLPDGWTQLGDTADSKRYAALGDAVTATVSEWIGRRLIAA